MAQTIKEDEYYCLYFWDGRSECFFDKDGYSYSDPRNPNVPHFKSREEATQWLKKHESDIGIPYDKKVIKVTEIIKYTQR